MLRPKKVIDSIVEYANIQGRWNLPNFKYTSWLEISDRLPDNRIEEAYMIKALTYYTNGELAEFREYAAKLHDISKTWVAISIYMTSLHTNGMIKEAINVFNDYIKNENCTTIDPSILHSHMTHCRWALENDSLKECYSRFRKDINNSLKENMEHTIAYNDRDLELLNYVGIDKNLFLEVMGVAIKTLSKFGNFTIGFDLSCNNPNDDLMINIFSDGIDYALMNELNEEWLDKIVDHDSEYGFKQLSRLLVNFQPANSNDGDKHAN